MEVVKAFDGLLTNAEVLELLSENRNGRPAKNTNFLLANREFIEVNTISYLKDNQTIKNTKTDLLECIRKIKIISPDLTEAEIVQVVNLLPSQAVELHAIIEECHLRLNEEQINQILAITSEFSNSG